MNTLFQEKHNHSENCMTIKVFQRTQLRFTLQMKDLVLHLLVRTWETFPKYVGSEIGVILREKISHKQKFAHDIVRINSFIIYTYLIEYNIVADTKAPLLRCFLFISKLKTR